MIKISNFFSDSAIHDSTPNNEISRLKKLLVLLSKKFLIVGVILGNVMNQPDTKAS